MPCPSNAFGSTSTSIFFRARADTFEHMSTLSTQSSKQLKLSLLELQYQIIKADVELSKQRFKQKFGDSKSLNPPTAPLLEQSMTTSSGTEQQPAGEAPPTTMPLRKRRLHLSQALDVDLDLDACASNGLPASHETHFFSPSCHDWTEQQLWAGVSPYYSPRRAEVGTPKWPKSTHFALPESIHLT